MPMANVWDSDAFGLVSLTKAIQLYPRRKTRIRDLGLFTPEGVSTNTLALEEIDGELVLLASKQRGGAANTLRDDQRRIRTIAIPHIPVEKTVLASKVQDVRSFASENQAEGVSAVVARYLKKISESMDLTEEWLMCGALKGQVLDGDGTSVLADLFSLFGITEQEVDFALGTDTTDQRGNCLKVKRAIEERLGNGVVYDHVHAFCGTKFFDRFTNHKAVVDSYKNYLESAFLRSDLRRGFEFCGIIFEEYSARVGKTDFIDQAQARFFPVGVPDLYTMYYGPADFEETVNTIGLPRYAKQEPLRFGRGRVLHAQTNPLPIVSRPGVLVKGKSGN